MEDALDMKSLKFSVEPYRSKERGSCLKCGNRVWIWCARCVCLSDNALPIPSVHLPLKLKVVRHSLENVRKSTAIPLALLAPESVELVTFDPGNMAEMTTVLSRFQAWNNASSKALLLFPDENAKMIDHPDIDFRDIEQIIAIDSTWGQAQHIRSHYLPNVKTCKLGSFKTLFWRYNDKTAFEGDECLATVEACYHLFKSLQQRLPSADYNVDDMLYLYEAQWYQVVQHKPNFENTVDVGKNTRERRAQLKNRNRSANQS